MNEHHPLPVSAGKITLVIKHVSVICGSPLANLFLVNLKFMYRDSIYIMTALGGVAFFGYFLNDSFFYSIPADTHTSLSTSGSGLRRQGEQKSSGSISYLKRYVDRKSVV